jgi:hypothetical protein
MNKPITIMELNDFFMNHKTNIQSTELDLLKCAGFEDSSFRNELCAKFSRPSKLGEYLNIHVCTVVIGEYIGDKDVLSAHFYQSNPMHPKNWIDDERPENLLGAKLDLPFISASSDVYVDGGSEILTEDKRMPMNIQEAIIACTRFEEESLRSAKKKEENLRKYHKLLSELSDNHTEVFDNLQKLHSVWCDIHNLEHMSADEMNPENEHQERWLAKYSKAWEGMDSIGYLHHYAYNNAGREL